MSLKIACGASSKRPILVSRHTAIINQFVQVLTLWPFPHCGPSLGSAREFQKLYSRAFPVFDCYSTGALRECVYIWTQTRTTCVLFSTNTNPSVIMESVCINRAPKFNCVHCVDRDRPFIIPSTTLTANRAIKMLRRLFLRKMKPMLILRNYFCSITSLFAFIRLRRWMRVGMSYAYPSIGVYRGS